MNLTPEVANLLRQALAEADYRYAKDDSGGVWSAYHHLADAVGNLLEPLPVAPAPAVPEGFVFVARWYESSVNLGEMARLYGEDAHCYYPGLNGGLPLIIRPIKCG